MKPIFSLGRVSSAAPALSSGVAVGAPPAAAAVVDAPPAAVVAAVAAVVAR